MHLGGESEVSSDDVIDLQMVNYGISNGMYHRDSHSAFGMIYSFGL